MRLKHYTDGYYCNFDTKIGLIDSESIEKVDYTIPFEERMNTWMDVGYCSERSFGWVALYASDEGLVLQINKRKWLLMDETVKSWYHDDFTNGTMLFGVESPEDKFKIRYDRWWEQKEENWVDPIYARDHVDNEDNDLFAFVDQLKNGDGSAENVLKSWQEQAAE